MLVGITGGIGSGKTTVSKMFSQYENVQIYHADDEAKKLMNTNENIRKQIIQEFSEEAYNSNGLNRPFLAKIVFEDKTKLKLLNTIVHPEVHKHLENYIRMHSDKDYILYENAILFENNSHVLCEKIIMVSAPEEIRIQRVMERDQVSRESVLNRVKNQWSDTKKTIQSHYLIINTNLSDVEVIVSSIHNKLTQ
ncbi:dephospho-CoA kinase [Tenacibaculum jejuense]|uniref:Dephospho-CoA kinase n=1 Tax=Tenacibaculum jejuense TaxID=584609 RepID=A0A238UCJ4_9FLAO|nr:dephospho-CoA kinase [Tenacibaculum jejuense]SNR16891.1 Dephospho-CoA kinase [Tenacibaculum jejuense]